jgi:uncharacterized protein involved in outer membrane biogenesis
VLNRIYIIVGVLAIIVLAGAFIAPRIIDWSDYRDRMEELASSVLGNDVIIRGDIEFSLLPQPRLRFSDVLVGAPERPAATVGSVEADFSLIEFLRDDYKVTRLVLQEPVIDLRIDESGLFGSGLAIAADGNSSVSLAEASIVNGTVRLADVRAGENFVASDLDGDLRLTSFSGPLQFQGGTDFDGKRYSIRFNSSAVDADGNSRITGYLQAVDGAFSLGAEGQWTTGIAPKFAGTMVYRQTPPTAEAADDIRGDLILEADIQGSTDRIVLTGYTLQPDENRAGTRLTGAASVQLGARRNFDAVISGGVFSLPPRDASEDSSALPYELVRLLAELPAPIIPPMPGRIGVDLAEMGLRGFALRDLRVDASTDGTNWQIEQFVGQLPGEAELRASGTLSAQDGRPAFNGRASLTTLRLDALAQIWRKPDESNPLFGMPGSLDTRVMLAGDALGLSNGVLTLDGTAHAVELRLGFGREPRLDVVGHFAELDAIDSAAVAALLPDIAAEPAFGTSFPNGSFSLSAERAQVLGQEGSGLVAEGQWGREQIAFTRLAAENLGGMGLDAALAMSGTLAAPVVSGTGVLKADGADAPALAALYDLVGTPEAWRSLFGQSLPGDVSFDLGRPDGEGGQTLSLDGVLGAAEIEVNARLADGLLQTLSAPLNLNGTLEANDPAALTRQLGFGDAALFPAQGDMMVAFNAEGSAANGIQAQVTASVGNESLSFSGNLLAAANGEIQGTGTLEGRLAEAAGLAEVVGARGLSLPMASGRADLHFEGERLMRLTSIEGQSGQTGFSGELSLSRTGSTAMVAGAIAIDAIDVTGLAGAVFGPASLIPGDDAWPDGPIAIGDTPRRTRGSIAVTTPMVTVGSAAKMSDASFELNWDETRMRVGRLDAAIGAGRVTLDLSVCCAGPLTDKTVNGRLTLAGVTLDDVAPPDVAAALGGTLDGGLQFEGTGASISSVLAALAGEGNFKIGGFSVDQLDPRVFPTVAGLDNVLEMDADALGAIMGLALGRGEFMAPEVNGAFTIAGGVGRLANLILEGDNARLAGEADLRLDTLGLSGSFALTPIGFTDPGGLVGDDNSQINTRLSGTLLEPVTSLDLDTMVAATQVRANEIEVDRLEALRAEDAERQRAAATERNRLIEEQRRRAAEEAERLAAEEAARQAAEEQARQAEEEARRLEQERLRQQPPPPPAQPAPSPSITGPLDLSLPPAVNQPGQGSQVNQPFFMPLN